MYVTFQHNPTQFCWLPPKKHNCTCSKWATGRSFYNGPSTLNLTISNPTTQAFLQKHHPHICSFETAAQSTTHPTTQDFFQIQLHDNTAHLVEHLYIHTQTFIQKDIRCIGEEETTGTWRYCSVFKYSAHGTKFCFFSFPEAAFATDHEDGKVNIKAWKLTTIQYYAFISTNLLTYNNKTTNECSNHGIVVHSQFRRRLHRSKI